MDSNQTPHVSIMTPEFPTPNVVATSRWMAMDPNPDPDFTPPSSLSEFLDRSPHYISRWVLHRTPDHAEGERADIVYRLTEALTEEAAAGRPFVAGFARSPQIFFQAINRHILRAKWKLGITFPSAA